MGAPIEFKVVVALIALALVGLSLASCVVIADRAQRAAELVDRQEGRE